MALRKRDASKDFVVEDHSVLESNGILDECNRSYLHPSGFQFVLVPDREHGGKKISLVNSQKNPDMCYTDNHIRKLEQVVQDYIASPIIKRVKSFRRRVLGFWVQKRRDGEAA